MDTEDCALPAAMMSSPLANVRLGTIMFKSAHSSVALNSRSSERRLMNTWAQIDTMIRYMIIKSGLRRWDTPALVRSARRSYGMQMLHSNVCSFEGARYLGKAVVVG